jgi:hypothetical protein
VIGRVITAIAAVILIAGVGLLVWVVVAIAIAVKG